MTRLLRFLRSDEVREALGTPLPGESWVAAGMAVVLLGRWLHG